MDTWKDTAKESRPAKVWVGEHPVLILPWEMWYVVYLRVQYWARNCLYCTLTTFAMFHLYWSSSFLLTIQIFVKYHVAMVKSKLSKSIAIIHKAKHLLDRRSGMILYFSLFLPYLSYCCEVWGNTYSSNIKNVYILQKKAVRIVCNVDYQHPSNVLFIELHVLKLHDLIELRTAMIMYKAKTGCLPVNLQTMFHMNLERIHDTRYSTNVRQVFARTTKKATCITVHGIKLWNKIQDRIRRSHNLHTFKKRFSKQLHSRYTLLMWPDLIVLIRVVCNNVIRI